MMWKSRVLYSLWWVAVIFLFLYTGNYPAMLLLILSFVCSVADLLLGFRSGLQMESHLELQPAYEREESFCAVLTIQNQSHIPICKGHCTVSWKNTLTCESGQLHVPFSIAGRSKTEITLEGSSHYCGECILHIEKAEVHDLLELIRCKRTLQAEAGTVILPQSAAVSMHTARREAYDMESFVYSEIRRGDDVSETFSIREYNPGDSVKRIHWKLTGRLGTTMIRESSYPVYDSILLLLESGYEDMETITPAELDAQMSVYVSVAEALLNEKVSFDLGVYHRTQQKFYLHHVESQEELWDFVPVLLKAGRGNSHISSIVHYMENYGDRRFAHYLYVTAGTPSGDTALLKQSGEVTVLTCGKKNSGGDGEIMLTPEHWEEELAVAGI